MSKVLVSVYGLSYDWNEKNGLTKEPRDAILSVRMNGWDGRIISAYIYGSTNSYLKYMSSWMIEAEEDFKFIDTNWEFSNK